MEKMYSFEVSAYGSVAESEVVAFLVNNGNITKEQAKTYTPTDDDIVSAIRVGLDEEKIRIDWGERLFVDFDENGNYEEVE